MDANHKKGFEQMLSPYTQRGVRLVTTTGCLAAMLVISVQAQTRDTRRIARRDTEDLSKFLREIERNDVHDPFFDRTEVDPNRINMSNVRTLVNRFADDANRLYQQIDVESRYMPRLRSELSDAMRLRSRAALVAQDAETARDLTLVANGVKELDRDWRRMSHNLKHMPQSTPRSITELVVLLDRTSGELEKAFQINPQFDRRALLTQVMAMRADFDNLIDDIELEMGTTVESRELVRASTGNSNAGVLCG